MPESESMELGGVLGHEGPTLIDLLFDRPAFELGVNGPGLLFKAIEVRTSLGLHDGCDYAAIRRFADGFKVTAYCGYTSPHTVDIRVAGSTLTPYVSIDIGPPSMYMTQLAFETVQGETFAELCERTLNPLARKRFTVALVPILNEEVGHGGHHSHSHEGAALAPSTVTFMEAPRRKYRIEYVLKPRTGGD